MKIKLALFIIIVLVAQNIYANENVNYFSIGAGPITGSYFPVASLLASAITTPPGSPPSVKGGSSGAPNMIAFARVTEGSVQNLEFLKQKNIDSAFIQADLLENNTNLKIIANLFPEHLHIIAKEKYSLTELKNKKICIGQNNSGSRNTIKNIFKLLHINIQKSLVSCGEPGVASDLLKSNNLDAILFFGNYPIIALENSFKGEQFKLLNIHKKHLDLITKTNPIFEKANIPKSVYNSQHDIESIKTDTFWVVNEGMEDSIIYDITKALWQDVNILLFKNNRPHSKGFDLNMALSKVNGNMLHNGAKKYYIEKGLIEEKI